MPEPSDMTATPTPFQQLLQIANRVGRSDASQAVHLQSGPYWSGIGFACGGYKFVAPMGEVVEILTVPGSTRLPRVKPWVRGVANVRGRLLPLVDLEEYFGGQLSANRRRHRVLILDLDELYCGLIVDEVYGIKHFPVESFSAENPPVDEPRQQISDGAYHAGEEAWALFSARRLFASSEFMDTAL